MNAAMLRDEAELLRVISRRLAGQSMARPLWFIARNIDDIAERVQRMEDHQPVPRSARAGLSVVTGGDDAA